MRATIWIPDDLFEAAEELAARLSLTRRRVYELALAEFLAKHDTARITAQLNEAYVPSSPRTCPTCSRGER